MLDNSSTAVVDVQGVPVQVGDASSHQGGDLSRQEQEECAELGLSVGTYLTAKEASGWGGGVVLQYKRDLVVKRFHGAQEGGGVRGEIGAFSRDSRSHLRFNLLNASCRWEALATLTLPGECFPMDGLVIDRWRVNLWKRIRRTYPLLKNAWLKEFQERGALHYHCLLSGRVDKEWLANAWYEVVGSGDRRHLEAGTRIEGFRKGEKAAACYVTRYLTKEYQKRVPEGFEHIGRWWGMSRGLVRPVATWYGDYDRMEWVSAYLGYRKQEELGRAVHLFGHVAGGVVFGGAEWGEEEATAAGLERL